MNETTSNTALLKARRLTPCPKKVSNILTAVSLIPFEALLPELTGELANLDEQYSQFLKEIAGIPNYDSYWPEEDPEAEDRQAAVQHWSRRLLELHRLTARLLSPLPERSRVHLWQEALGPQARGDEHYGPRGLLSPTIIKRQQKLANRLGPLLAKNFSASITQLSKFLAASEENVQLHFWALFGLIKEYEFIRESREHLSKIVRLCKTPGEERIALALVGFSVDIKQTYTVDEQGHFSPIKNRFTDALLDEDLDLTRIRACDNCKKFFWAGRIDQKCCTRQCNHARHSKKTREKYRQGYYQGGRD
jgi:hypothetical protein